MSTTTWIDKEHGPSEGVCPRCGATAQWTYAPNGQTQVRVSCPDCGPFEVDKEDFDVAASDLPVPDEYE